MKKKIAAFFEKDFSYPEKNKSLEDFTEKKKLMNFNRFFSNFKVFTTAYIAGVFLLLIVLIAVINRVQGMRLDILTGEVTHEHVSIFNTISSFWQIYLIILVVAVLFYGKFAYNVRVSFGNLNVGQKGTASWTTREELEQQYKKVPEKDARFPGVGGIPIARDEDEIYIDDTNVNNLVIGITRSGKGQTTIEPMIDINSRAEEQSSMVIADPKLELSSKMMPELQRRGYECYVLNLIDPEFSMGYNPLRLIIDEYKNGKIDVAQQLCASLAYNVIPQNEGERDPYFTDQARNVFIAAVMAEIEDNLERDRMENRRYKREHNKKEKAREMEYYKGLYGEEYDTYLLRKAMDRILRTDPEMTNEGVLEELLERIEMEIITDISIDSLSVEAIEKARHFKYKESLFYKKPYYPSTEHEERITIYSIIKFCNALAEHRIGENRTALDDYFSKRDEDNFARITYGAIISASAQTKGTIMSVFRSKVAIFGFESIAKMTAESSVDFAKLGFGKKPVAIFIGLPDYDKSNWFIATVFINQLYFISSKLATAMPGGKLARRISFILDEFGNIPPIDNMSNIMTVCLGRNMTFTLVIQSFKQLENVYKESATTIEDNCGNLIYILSGGKETAQEISDRLGNETITTLNRTGKKLSINKELTEMSDQKALLTADEVMKMKMGETIVFRVMFRETRTGTREPIQAKPIANMGKYRMKYSYEFFPDYFPQDQMLYESPQLRRIFQANENLKNLDLKTANVKLERTTHIVLKDRSRSANKYLAETMWRNSPFLDNEFGIGKVNKIFDLMNLSQNQKEIYSVAGKLDEDGEVVMPEHILYNGQIMDYAEKLLGVRNNEVIEKGYELLQLMKPVYLKNKKKSKEEIISAEKQERDLLNAINENRATSN